ncbi:homeobox protein knotted-1-like protein 3 isoform X1 [Tanacetum coccineum]
MSTLISRKGSNPYHLVVGCDCRKVDSVMYIPWCGLMGALYDVRTIGWNDCNARYHHNVIGGREPVIVTGDGEGGMSWQNARQKAEVLSHPSYEQLLAAHVACLRIATPVDQLPRIDAQLAQSQ